MANPHALSIAAPYDGLGAGRGAGGVWSLAGDGLLNIADFAPGAPDARGVVLVPSEQVLLLAVALPPIASPVRRREALPFAIEDRISVPLDRVHIALGAEMAPGVWLAAVVGHEWMGRWLDRLAEAGLERAALVPDALALPIPGAGSWSVALAGDRAMVRSDDGTGFAVPLALLDAAWRAAGQPACIAYGEPLPPPYAADPIDADLIDADPIDADLIDAEAETLAGLLVPAIDLRQGPYAAPRRPIHPLWQRIALVAGIGALAHGAIALADTAALAHLAQQRAAQVRMIGANLQPPVEIGDDLGAAIVALSPDAAATGPSRFMALLSRSAAALSAGQPPTAAPAGAAMAQTSPASVPVWRSVSFDGAAGTLTIEVETGNIADLQRMAQALTSAGLSAQPGSASTQGGKAVGSFVVRAL